MKTIRSNPVSAALAAAYERSAAGRTGRAERDFQIDYRELLRQAQAGDGEARAIADAELAAAAEAGILVLEKHPRDPSLIFKIRLPLANEPRFYERLGLLSPTQKRANLAGQFSAASQFEIAETWRPAWVAWCDKMRQAAVDGQPAHPLSIQDPAGNLELLRLIPKLLDWREESLLRFASCVLCGHSKRLEALSGKLGALLEQVTSGEYKSLENLGLLENPRFVLCHGPLRLQTPSGALDLGLLTGPFRLSMGDIVQAVSLTADASRCLAVENETTFHELAKLRSGCLLLQTSYPGKAVLALLSRLPDSLEFWHFGDSDPDGFDILRDLRERSGLPFRGLHMRFRPQPKGPELSPEERRKLERLISLPAMEAERAELRAMLAAGHKGRFEQESLGRPAFVQWPFY
jgi:hypothetical protein